MKARRTSSRGVLALGILLCAAGASGAADASTVEPDRAGHASAALAEGTSPIQIPGQVIVRFLPGTSSVRRASVHARLGARLIRRTEAIDADLVQLPGAVSVASAVRSYASLPAVASVEPNLAGRIALAPNDACIADEPCSGIPQQWHLAMTNAHRAWDLVPGRTLGAADAAAMSRPTIAVLDTKIDATHPDFTNGGASSDAGAGGQLDLASARDWIPASKWGGAAAYHGTFVAGLAAASAGNGLDAAGLGYAARILPLTVVDGSGNTDAAALADAIVYAWERGARVINLSLGILGDSTTVRDAIRLVTRGTAERAPSLVVAAAGNNTGSSAFYPGSYPEVLSVSGTDAHDRRASCSNHNANVSVAAPADRLVGLTTMPTERFQAACGTSAAAPQVSGLAALLFLQDPTRTPAQVRAIIEATADDLGPAGRDDDTGHGRINAERALGAAGPAATRVRATVASARDMSTTITAAAEGSSVRAAHAIVGHPDAAPIAMQAADGSFGGTSELLRVTLRLPAGTRPGPVPVWVRAFDGISWGPASVAVVGVDGKAPTISSPSAGTAVRATGQGLTVSFTLTDDYAIDGFAWGVQFFSSTTGALVFQDSRANATFGRLSYTWTPPLTAPGGHYSVKIVAVDPSGNASSALVGAVVT